MAASVCVEKWFLVAQQRLMHTHRSCMRCSVGKSIKSRDCSLSLLLSDARATHGRQLTVRMRACVRKGTPTRDFYKHTETQRRLLHKESLA